MNEGIAVVDAKFPEQSAHLIGELKKQSTQPFKVPINTHHHGDLSSGNISFKGTVERVPAHANSKANQERVAKEKKTEDQQLYAIKHIQIENLPYSYVKPMSLCFYVVK